MISDYLVFDIETKAGPRTDEYWDTYKRIKPDARLKDPDKIKASIEEKREKGKAKAALDHRVNEIVMIGCSFRGDKKHFVNVGDQREMLQEFASYCSGKVIHETVAFNANFDKFGLVCKFAECDLPIPDFLRNPIRDVMFYYCDRYNRDAWVSLDDLAFLFNMERKTLAIEEYFEAVENEDWATIIEYNEQDLEITETAYLKYWRNQELYL